MVVILPNRFNTSPDERIDMRIKRLIVIVLCLIMLVLPFASGCGSEVQEDVDQSMTESQLESQTAIGGEETETMKTEDREYDLPISWESLKQTGKNNQSTQFQCCGRHD